jgi:hypothetical protein
MLLFQASVCMVKIDKLLNEPDPVHHQGQKFAVLVALLRLLESDCHNRRLARSYKLTKRLDAAFPDTPSFWVSCYRIAPGGRREVACGSMDPQDDPLETVQAGRDVFHP